MIKEYSIKEVSNLLDIISLTDLLEVNDLEEADIVRYLLNEGVLSVPEHLENAFDE